MLRWFIRTPSMVKKARNELEKVKAENAKQRLLLKEALQQLMVARNKGNGA